MWASRRIFPTPSPPSIAQILEARQGGELPAVPYTLADMAEDVTGLMDALGLESAHLAGISMGGMIVQQTALQFPGRVRSMTSIMSSTSDPALPGPTPEAQAALVEPAPREREAYLEYSVRTGRAFTGKGLGKGFAYDAEKQRALAGRVYDRAFDPRRHRAPNGRRAGFGLPGRGSGQPACAFPGDPRSRRPPDPLGCGPSHGGCDPRRPIPRH